MTPDDLTPIELAKTPDFRLGAVAVRPSHRELVAPGATTTLEPRVMQVLVALAKAGGETVSRDTLIARCWDGVVVGEDAIQRCIGRLRKAADALGGFEIETLSRIGYRLIVNPTNELGEPSRSFQPRRLLAVLPFDNLSADPGLAYVADGVADEILRAIAHRSTIRAIGRTSSFQFRGADKVVPQISEALGATHVLDGSVRRAGQKVRVAAHLMDLSDQTMIWSDRFDGVLDELFELQEVVAASVVEALNGMFVRPRASTARSPHAHDLILRLGSWTGPPAAEEVGGRMGLMRELASLAGDDAEAWGLIAAAYAATRWVVPPDEEPEVRHLAGEAAGRALILDPADGGAHTALFLMEPPIGRYLPREQRLIAARDAAPQDGEIHWSLYTHFLSVGRLKASFEAAETAYRVDPLRPANVMAYANALFTADREAQALALMRHALDRWPQDPVVFAIAVWTAASAGEFGFVDQVMTPVRLDGFDPGARELVAPACFAAEALRSPTKPIVAAALDQMRADISAGRPRFSLLGLCAALGADLDELYDLFDAVDLTFLRGVGASLPPLDGPSHLFLRVNARLRQSPRFIDLCRRLSLIDYWRETGAAPDFLDEVRGLYSVPELRYSLSGPDRPIKVG